MHPGRIRPSDPVALVQELACDRLAHAESAPRPELKHPPDGLTAVFPIEARLARKTRQGGGEHLFHGLETAALQLLLNDALVFGLELDRHNFNLAVS